MRYLLSILLLTSLSLGQTNVPAEQSVERPVGATSISNRIEKMQGLLNSLSVLSNQLEQARKEHDAAVDAPTREELDRRIKSLVEQNQGIEASFEELAIGANVDRSLFYAIEKPPFDLRSELEKLAEPLVDEMKRATADSQRESALGDELDRQRKRRIAAEAAVANIQRLLEPPASPVDGQLQDLLKDWTARLGVAKSQEEQVSLQLLEIEAAKKPILESSRAYLSDFMKNRGLHLLLGILAFCFVFFGLRGLYALYRKARPVQHFRTFASRLLSLLYHLFTSLAAVGALLLAFQLTNDWFLLTLSIIFLIGVGWVSIKTLPTMFEQVKLMLNFGAVREYELLMYEGIPWKVEDLGLTAVLVNPFLSGGEQILPIRDLVGLASRRPGDNEPWFPSREGDWVKLTNGLKGQVICQTPYAVVIRHFGCSEITMTVPEYLAQSPENLSCGFRIEQVFGVDYQHQAEATTRIPEVMQATLVEGLHEAFDDQVVDRIIVNFSSAASSSLDYRVDVWCFGEAAPLYEQLERAIPRLLVDACNENEWVIPFMQVRVHGGLG